MIDTTELMIGDWIKMNNDSKKFTAGYVITLGIDNATIGLPMEQMIENVDDIDKIYPIQLTMKILEDNGFIYEGDDEYGKYYMKNMSVFEIRNTHGVLWGKCMNDDVFINYVHELQQLLRRCGLKDTANSFTVTL